MNNAESDNLAIRVRARVWLDTGGKSSLSDAGADLLEQIAAHGSLSEAARRLHFSYRRAWMLLDAMNRAWAAPLVATATGGKGGGGARLTELGEAVLSTYRHVQLELEHFLDQQIPTLAGMIKPHIP
jgi:molybdate transport system regulatory protein